MELVDRVAIVTGSAHRVGKAIAVGLAREGMHVVVHYHRSAAQAADTVGELRGLGVRATGVRADLATEAGVGALFETVRGEFADLAVLVNSASVMEPIGFLSLTPADWDRTLNINVRSAFMCGQRAARLMLERDGGCIVNVLDLAAFRPWLNYPAHSVSKAGLEMLTRVMARSLAPRIRVNAVAPGPVAMPAGWEQTRWDELGAKLPLRRTGSASDVAESVLFLLKQDFITGETLVVDGGRSLI